MRVGVVSTQRHPPDPVNWLAVHINKGVTAFYIRFEDTPNGPAVFSNAIHALGKPGVILRTEIAPPVDRTSEDNYRDIQGRQTAWVNKAARMASADGVAWLFHIDDDEVLVTPTSWPEVVAGIPTSCDAVHLTNWEAFAPAQPTGSFFTDPGVRYLGSECAHLYSAYGNGKGGARVTPTTAALGVHHFAGRECELPTHKGLVAHFEALPTSAADTPPARWMDKHMLRAKDDTRNIPFASTREGIAAARAGDVDALRSLWFKYRTTDGERFRACPMPHTLSLW